MLSLRRKADFHALFQHGRRAYGPWAVLYARLRLPSAPGLPASRMEGLPGGLPASRLEAPVEGLPAGPRLAASTTGKFPNAVQRNRARRLLRETCRLLISELREPWDILFIVRPAILTTTFSERQQAITALLRQAGLPVPQELACPERSRRASCPSDPEGTLGVPKGAPPKEPALT